MTIDAEIKSQATWSTKRLTGSDDAADVVDFARTFLHVDKGMRAGEPLVLVQWQVDLMHALYERRVDGRRRYRRALIGLGRKNGNSVLGSLVALHGLVEGGMGAEV